MSFWKSKNHYTLLRIRILYRMRILICLTIALYRECLHKWILLYIYPCFFFTIFSIVLFQTLLFAHNQTIPWWKGTCTLGWSDFEKKCYTLYVVPNCCWTPIPKFHVLMLPISLVAKPLKIWTVTLKSTHKIFFQTFLKPATKGKRILWFFLKAKNTVKWKKICLTLYRSKTVLPNFCKIKIHIKLFFPIFFM